MRQMPGSLKSGILIISKPAHLSFAGFYTIFSRRSEIPPNPHISCSARNADRPERRLEVGFLAARLVKAD
jgi:hypothetical protein